VKILMVVHGSLPSATGGTEAGSVADLDRTLGRLLDEEAASPRQQQLALAGPTHARPREPRRS